MGAYSRGDLFEGKLICLTNFLKFVLQNRALFKKSGRVSCLAKLKDKCVFSNEIEHARKLVASVQEECRKVGLEINAEIRKIDNKLKAGTN